MIDNRKNIMAYLGIDNEKSMDEKHYSKLSENRQFYFYGYGGTAEHVLGDLSGISIKGFTNCNEKERMVYVKDEQYHLVNVKKLPPDSYIIVTSVYYNEIKKDLISEGKGEFIDFISYQYLYPKPSIMLEMVCASDRVTDWKCMHAFNTAKLQGDGTVDFCQCNRWLAFSNLCGNAFFQNMDEIENSIITKLFRYSIEKGQYCFCTEACPGFREYGLNLKETSQLNRGYIKKTAIATFDKSCNLKCQTCRNNTIYEKSNRNRYLTEFMIEQMIPNYEIINCAGDGEVFASEYYKKIVASSIDKEIIFQTNGCLASPEIIDRLLQGNNRKIVFSVSVDAATKETYEEIRRGGDFDQLIKNLGYIGEQVQCGKIEAMILNYVISAINVDEILPFVDVARKLGAQAINFTKVENWGTYSDEEYSRVSVFHKNGEAKSIELKMLLEKLEDADDIKIFIMDDYSVRLFINEKLERVNG